MIDIEAVRKELVKAMLEDFPELMRFVKAYILIYGYQPQHLKTNHQQYRVCPAKTKKTKQTPKKFS